MMQRQNGAVRRWRGQLFSKPTQLGRADFAVMMSGYRGIQHDDAQTVDHAHPV
ncbi:Uncharacterised protein [Mycobacterium tuberculosis]|nr:Uncharacterised protein [Mycobacterium tuberculosis]